MRSAFAVAGLIALCIAMGSPQATSAASFAPDTLIFTEQGFNVLTVEWSPSSSPLLDNIFTVTKSVPSEEWTVTFSSPFDSLFSNPGTATGVLWTEPTGGSCNAVAIFPAPFNHTKLTIRSELVCSLGGPFPLQLPDSTSTSPVMRLSGSDIGIAWAFVDLGDLPVSTPEMPSISLLAIGVAGMGIHLYKNRSKCA